MKKGLVVVLMLALATSAFAGTAWYGGLEPNGTTFEQGKLAKWQGDDLKGTLEATGSGWNIQETDGNPFYAFPSIDGTTKSAANMVKIPDGRDYTIQYEWTMPTVLLVGTRNWAPQFFFEPAGQTADPKVATTASQQGTKLAVQYDYQTSGTNVDKIRVKMKNDLWHSALRVAYGGTANETLLANSWCAGGAGTWPFYIPRADLAGKNIILKAVRVAGGATPKVTLSMVVDGVNQPLMDMVEGAWDFTYPGVANGDNSGADATWMWIKGPVAEDMTLFITSGNIPYNVNADLIGSAGVPSLSVPAFAE